VLRARENGGRPNEEIRLVKLSKSIAGIAISIAFVVGACGGNSASPTPAATATTGATPTTAATATTAGSPSTAPGSSAPAGSGSVTGDIHVTGSSTVQPISQAVSEAFKALNPNFGFTVEGPGTGPGMAALCAGETDVADASRKIKPDDPNVAGDEEATVCKNNGIEYTELKIAFDGITVMTHPDTPLDCLTKADLYALFGPESDSVANWKDAQALATELGSTTQFPDLPLQITAPGEESGTYDAFLELAGITSTGTTRGKFDATHPAALRLPGPNYTASPDDNVIVAGVENASGSLGFVGFAYFEGAGTNVKALAIDGGKGCVAPTRETIADGSYPLSRGLYIYPNNAKAASNPAVKAWVDFYLSDAGIANVGTVGYVPLPADQLQASRDAWANH
jgi:phosphate transport system substrate-binding protein